MLPCLRGDNIVERGWRGGREDQRRLMNQTVLRKGSEGVSGRFDETLCRARSPESDAPGPFSPLAHAPLLALRCHRSLCLPLQSSHCRADAPLPLRYPLLPPSDFHRGGSDLSFIEGDAERLPLADNSVDSYTIAFGLRNVTRPDLALREAARVLRRGGRFLCLEFSHVELEPLKALYDAYSFSVIPMIGRAVAGDAAPYQYLVESIRKFPRQEELADMMRVRNGHPADVRSPIPTQFDRSCSPDRMLCHPTASTCRAYCYTTACLSLTRLLPPPVPSPSSTVHNHRAWCVWRGAGCGHVPRLIREPHGGCRRNPLWVQALTPDPTRGGTTGLPTPTLKSGQ